MKQAKILTKAEYKRVMHVIDAHRYAVRNRTMFALSFYAGLRACEIAGLKVGDVFSEEGNVRDTLYLGIEQTKGNEQQQVIVSKQLQKQFDLYAKQYNAHTKQLLSKTQNKFPNEMQSQMLCKILISVMSKCLF